MLSGLPWWTTWEGRDVPELVLEVEGDGAGPAMHPEWFFRGVERWEWWDQQLLPLIGQGPVLDPCDN
jgi:hypothetical protein